MRTKSESYAYNQISLFASTLAIVIAVLFYLARFGFTERYITPLLGFTGVSLIVLLSPVFIQKPLKLGMVGSLFVNDTILPLYVLFCFCILGLFIGYHPVTVSVVVLAIGLILYTISAFQFLKETPFYISIISILMTLAFGVYAGATYWSLIADPLYIENMSIGKSHVDSFFHSAIAQMVKTHGIPSTGIDLTPMIKYHFGSHYLIGKLSAFLSCGVIDFYNFGFLIIFFPLVVRTLLSFILIFRKYILSLNKSNLDFIFWFLLFTPFIGFMAINGYSIARKAGIGGQAIVWSESYAVSFIYAFILFSSCVFFREIYKNKLHNRWTVLGSVALFFAALLMLTSVTKISTGFLLFSCFGYLYLRLQLYKQWRFTLSFIFISLCFIGMYMLTNDTDDEEGGAFYLFHLIREIIAVPWYIHLIVFYSLSITFCFVLIYAESISNSKKLRDAFWDYRTLTGEILLVIAIVGFIPGAVLKFFGGNAIYFAEVQYWIAASFILCYLSSCTDKIKSLYRERSLRSWIIAGVLGLTGLYIGYKMQRNLGEYCRWVVDRNLKDRVAMLGSLPSGYAPRLELINSFKKGTSDSLLTVLGVDVEKKVSTIEQYNFLRKLRSLDTLPLTEKRKHLLYVKNLYNSPLAECYKIHFIFPAFTGIALYKGVPVCSEAVGYGIETYRKNQKQDNCYEKATGCDYLLEAGFSDFIEIDAQKLTLEDTRRAIR